MPSGGSVFLSPSPVSPAGRVNQSPFSGSTITNSSTGFDDGSTTTTSDARYPGQAFPVCFGVLSWATGGSSGLPQAHRTRGTPRSSTSTAVPAWSTAWYAVAFPSRKP